MDAATITGAGLEVLDEVGFDRLSMRQVAARLGVHAGGLYYHVPDKASLLRAMADVVCERALHDLEGGGGWRDDALALCLGVRRSLLGLRDGARLLAASPLFGSEGALALMERLLGILGRGLPAERVGTAADTLLSYVTGYVLQEQLAETHGFDPELAARLGTRFPLVAAYGASTSSDETFTDAVRAIVAGFAS